VASPLAAGTTMNGVAAAPGTKSGAASGQALAPIIRLSGVTRRYRVGQGTVTALADVNLEVEPGELAVVLGPSGSGKTTLLNLIGALDVATEGTIEVAGHTLTGAGRAELFRFRRQTVSFVFQTFNLFPGLTALENVRFAADIVRLPDATRTAQEMLERVGLGDRVHHFAHQLSGGEQQRVAIARALATGNPIMLADEPTGELDYRTGRQILELLQVQSLGGVTVLVVTHNREIARAAGRVIELSGGRVVSDAPPPGGAVAISKLRW
jgi:putative ABC transport system ATP-binding protein